MLTVYPSIERTPLETRCPFRHNMLIYFCDRQISGYFTLIEPEMKHA